MTDKPVPPLNLIERMAQRLEKEAASQPSANVTVTTTASGNTGVTVSAGGKLVHRFAPASVTRLQLTLT